MNGLGKAVLSARMAALAAALVLAAGTAAAQSPTQRQQSATHQASGMNGQMSGTKSGTARDPFMKPMKRMDRGMAAVSKTGTVDQQFVAMMIPHHRGAIAMARIELSRGKDPMLKRMAHQIIVSQRRQIKQMRAWEKKHPVAH